MKLESIYPVLGTDLLAESRDFYLKHFPFQLTFESDWYVSLITKADALAEDTSHAQLALLDCTHKSVPESFRTAATGLLLNFEVTDVDAEFERLKSAGLPMHLELRSEDWGQRHFITSDPNGVLIDVIQLIPPSEEYAKQYDKEIVDYLNSRG